MLGRKVSFLGTFNLELCR